MKEIKIKICGFDENNGHVYGHYILNVLRRHYNVRFVDDPDYLFFHEASEDYLDYDCIRIFFASENITPNFNFCDYAIGFDFINFEDRYYRFPLYLVSTFYNNNNFEATNKFDLDSINQFGQKDLDEKTGFCSFVSSNYLASEKREEMFNKLNKYKKVDSGGGYLNNIGGRIKNKIEFESKYKFSIAFENSSRSGYTTEKIVTAFAARTIPVYWGDPSIERYFNKKRFINCNNFNNFEDVVEIVKKIDKDDNLFLSIMNEPIASSGHNFKSIRVGFEEFLKSIFNQSLNKARRRTINPIRAIHMEKNEKNIIHYSRLKDNIKSVLSILYKPFKKIKYIESIKYWFFKKAK